MSGILSLLNQFKQTIQQQSAVSSSSLRDRGDDEGGRGSGMIGSGGSTAATADANKKLPHSDIIDNNSSSHNSHPGKKQHQQHRHPKRKYSAPRILLIIFCLFLSTTTLHKELLSLSDQYDDMPYSNPNTPRAKRMPKPQSTLVHYDPYFIGGFRNQHMRFVGFVNAAVNRNVSQILLPSLRWSDHYNKSKSIAHELLFDVDYWNSRAESKGLPLLVDYDPNVLEGIIEIENIGGSSRNETEMVKAKEVLPCWNETSSLYSGLDEAVLRNPGVNLRKTPTWSWIGQNEPYRHCCRTFGTPENSPSTIKEEATNQANNATNTKFIYRFTHLIPHGGLQSSGRLWWEYSGMQNKRNQASVPTIINGEFMKIHPEHHPVERAMYELLRPSKQIRLAYETAIRTALQRNNTTNTMHHNHDRETTTTNNEAPRLLALHPRVEQDMLTHWCSKFMEKNLSRVFERMESFPPFFEQNTNGSKYRMDLVFIAVSKALIAQKAKCGGELGDIMDGNRVALNNAREHGLFAGINNNSSSSTTSIPMFESGTEVAKTIQFPRLKPSSTLHFVTGNRQKIYPQIIPPKNTSIQESPYVSALDMGVLEVVASIINFFTAVKAEIFVGVKGSTFSMDVFSVRYYQHKDEGGGENYIVGPNGIERLYGPAAPHACM